MIVLLLFAFLSGLVTIFAPCIWPLLPIILSSSTTGGHRKPLGITLGIISSFSVFTLSISYLVMLFHFDPEVLRLFAVVVIGFLGLSMIIPSLQEKMEGFVSRLSSSFGQTKQRSGFLGGFITGISLGIIWSPCAGPILATIATLAVTQSVNIQTVFITLAYALGVGIPLFIFSYAGAFLFTKSRFISKYTGRIQQLFGIIMILTALAIFTNYDKLIQAKLLDLFPSYTSFLTNLENNKEVQTQLDIIKGKKDMGEVVKEQQGDLPIIGSAADFTGGGTWLNSNPLTLQQLKGKVVLVDFWTYTCINCIRTLTFVTGWYEKYKDQGFVVVGVHTPEFEFEKKTENVQNAIKMYNIHYPVVQDNDYNIWNAYDNHYWPAKYLIDAKGNVRLVHFGEGQYEETEKAIKTLLKEKGQTVDNSTLQTPAYVPNGSQTSETYLGSKRMDFFASNEAVKGGQQTFSAVDGIPEDTFAYRGTWDVQDEYTQSVKDSEILLHFLANKVFLVITPASKNDQIKVLLDGKPVSINAGKDVKNSLIQIDQPRLYELINIPGEKNYHFLRLQFLTPGTKVFAFTFG
jgi:cytochrome c biogenesis protein CcdA/thiol-disulfide isomerase/thioredoxin